MERVALNLRASLNTDTVSHDVKPFGEDANTLQNTGIERDGGVTNIYQETTALTDLETVYSVDDTRVSINPATDPDLANVFIDGANIGTVSAWGRSRSARIAGYDDVYLTEAGTVIAARFSEGTITVSEYAIPLETEELGAPLHTRSTTFINIVDLSKFFTSLSIVRADTLSWSDSLEFALRLGEQVIILNENNPNIPISVAFSSTTVLGTSTALCSLVYNTYLIIAGANGRVGSFDGSKWRNYDGTGEGVGPYYSGLLGGSQINTMLLYGSSIVLGGSGGRIASYNGSQWFDYNTAGTGLWNNSTVISTDNVTAMYVWKVDGVDHLVVGGSAGKLGSWDGTSWKLYNGTTGVANNATIIGAVQINSMISSISPSQMSTLLVAGASGRVGSLQYGEGLVLASITSPAPGGSWVRMKYGNGVWIAITSNTGASTGIARSTDKGLTWSMLTTPVPAAGWVSVDYGNGVWIAVASSNSTTASMARSVNNGVTWTMVTLQTHFTWTDIAYGDGVWLATCSTYSTASLGRSSNDGVTWELLSTPYPQSAMGYYCVGYGNGAWIITAGGGTAQSGPVQRSTNNGTSWTAITVPISGTYAVGRPIYLTNDIWLLFVGIDLFRSTDAGLTWSQVTTPTHVQSWRGAALGNAGTVVASTAYGNATTNCVFRSADYGATWLSLVSPNIGASAWGDVVYAEGVFVVQPLSTSRSFVRSVLATNTTPYSTATSAETPTNNGTVVSTDNILCTAPISSTSSIFCSSLGNIGVLTDGTWLNYNSGEPTCSNATALGAVAINTAIVYTDYVIIGGAQGRVASFDKINQAWKNYDGTGSGVSPFFADGTVIGTNTIYSLAAYNSKVIASGANGYASSMFSTDGSTMFSTLLIGFNQASYLYTYRYSNNQYLVNLVGNTNNLSYLITDLQQKTVKSLAIRYAIPQKKNGKTRHIVTGDPTYDASTVRSIGFLGYTDFVNFSDFIVYPTISAPGITAITAKNIGFGYSDFAYSTSSATYSFGPKYASTETALYSILNSNTSTLLNAYGKLNNRIDVSTTTPLEFRVLWINGVQAALSVAVVDGPTDNMGVLLTTVGEFDDSFTPIIAGDNTVLYRYDDNYYVIKLSTTEINRLQRNGEGLVKINTASPVNLVDLTSRSLKIGSSDFNGRIQPVAGTYNAAAIPVAAVCTGDFSNSVDVGAKLFYLSSVGSGNINVIGYNIPYTLPSGFAIDVYVSGVYSFSVFNDNNELADVDKASMPYVPEQRNPIPIGANYSYKTARTKTNSLVLADAYDGYYPGNELVGNYQFFDLFGGLYAFDGRWIYLISFNGNYISNPTKIANGLGLRYITASPTEAYFISDFDNSLYTFSGGREIVKAKRMNQLESVVQGVFNSHDATLLLTTPNTYIWIRDQVVTQNNKPTVGTKEHLYTTSSGIRIIEDSTAYRYSYKPVGSVVPLTWQSAYFGLDKNLKNATTAYVVTIFNEAKTPITVDGVIRGFDQDKFDEQKVRLSLTSKDFDSNGYARVRIQPRKQKNLGTSIELSCASKIVLVDAFIEAVPDAAGTVNKARSR